MSCAAIRSVLTEFVGGELAPRASAQVREHLIVCSDCRREAGALQRARGALQSAAAHAMQQVDEAAFAAMHRSIVAATTAATGDGASVPAMPGRSRGWWLAAAALLVGGAWFGMRAQRDHSVWHRPPTATPTATSIVVPWSGDRLDSMRWLGDDSAGDDSTGNPGDGIGAGLLGRHRLRSLVDDGILLPPPQRPR